MKSAARYRLVGTAVAVSLLSGCGENAPGPTSTTGLGANVPKAVGYCSYSYGDLYNGRTTATCTDGQVVNVTASYLWFFPEGGAFPPNYAPFTVLFDRPIRDVWVTFSGVVRCDGTSIGSVNGHPFGVLDSTCVAGGVWPGGDVTWSSDTGMTSLAFEPMDPTSWVRTADGTTWTEWAWAPFTIYFTVPLPPCPTTGDPNLDDQLTYEALDSSWHASNPDSDQLQRMERLRAGYRDSLGHVVSIDLNIQSNNCENTADFTVPLEYRGADLAWIWHSHPYQPGELVPLCLGETPLDVPQPYLPTPSRQDWQGTLAATNLLLFAAGKPPVPGYIWDKATVMKMFPNAIDGSPRDSVQTWDRSMCPK